MSNNRSTLISIIGLIGTYASYLIPSIVSKNLTYAEVLLITFFSSILFLTIFIASVFVKINEFKYKIKCLENSQEIQELKTSMLKDESKHLKTLSKEIKHTAE